MGLHGTGFYLQAVFLVQEETLLHLGYIYLALEATRKKSRDISCIVSTCSQGVNVVLSNARVSAARSSLRVDSVVLLSVRIALVVLFRATDTGAMYPSKVLRFKYTYGRVRDLDYCCFISGRPATHCTSNYYILESFRYGGRFRT